MIEFKNLSVTEEKLLQEALADIKKSCSRADSYWPEQREVMYISRDGWEKVLAELINQGILYGKDGKKSFFLSTAGYEYLISQFE